MIDVVCGVVLMVQLGREPRFDLTILKNIDWFEERTNYRTKNQSRSSSFY